MAGRRIDHLDLTGPHDAFHLGWSELHEQDLGRILRQLLQPVFDLVAELAHAARQALLHDAGLGSRLGLHHRGPRSVLQAGHLLPVVPHGAGVVHLRVYRWMLARLNDLGKWLALGVDDGDFTNFAVAVALN